MPRRRLLLGSALLFAAATSCGRSGPHQYGQGGSGGVSSVRGAFGSTELALGSAHSCLRNIYGDVLCWGDNARGALGSPGSAKSSVPLAVKLPGRARGVAAGASHTCAVLEDESVYCWGANDKSQLGVTSGHDEPAPIRVPLPTGEVQRIALGNAHSCALLRDSVSDSTLYCWGDNGKGQIGIGMAGAIVIGPTKIATHVPEIALGGDHSVGIFKSFKTDGESDLLLTGWGENSLYELGSVGEPAPAPLSATLLGLSGVAVGPGHHACALFDGQGMKPGVYCWGANDDAQLGRNTMSIRELPGPVVGAPSPVAALALGFQHTCALSLGHVFCWGDNALGQLGNGGHVPSSVPIMGPSLQGVRAIASGAFHTCAVVSDADIECWGANDAGQLGDGSTMARVAPVKVAFSG